MDDPVKHHNIIIGRIVPDVNQKENSADRSASMKIVLYHGSPLLFDGGAGPREAVSRQIDQIKSVVDVVVVDGLCFAGFAADARVRLPVHQRVDQR